MSAAVASKSLFWNKIKAFLSQEAFPGIFLVFAALLALIFANSGLASSYFSWWDLQLTIGFGSWALEMTFGSFINDFLMAIFFLMIGLEVKREILAGELSTGKKAAFPIVAALGGMIVPAAIYIVFNLSMQNGNIDGFGIPVATDIAFALGVLMLLGKRVPVALKVLLMSLAVADDIGAIIVIAIFYSSNIAVTYLLVALAAMIFLFILNMAGVRSLVPYLLVGLVIWFCFEHSGIHAAIAGILLALTIPAAAKISVKQYTAEGRAAMNKLDQTGSSFIKMKKIILSEHQQEVLDELGTKYKDITSPLLRLEHGLAKPVSFFILPLFAFANAGVTIGGEGVNLLSPVALGILLGLVVGKPLGITGLTFLMSKLGWIEKPPSISWKQIIAMSMICGIGFTMSIFITLLAFTNADSYALIASSKLAILIGSLVAGILGAVYMLRVTKKPQNAKT
ncbi:MAG: Na+/H+ antiporter NhaA [Chloroflexi bacterium]|nr:Na+/H+ antiporter NhaA [Chloroflexota bacterium]